MSIFLFILINNILPIFILIILGFMLSRKFNFDIFTLSKLNFYFFVPSFVFVNLYTTVLDWSLFKIIFYCGAYLIFNDLTARFIGKMRGYQAGKTNALKNALSYANMGNIGLSLIILVFSTGSNVVNGETPYLITAQTALIIAMVFNNITTNTLGFYNAGRASMTLGDSVRKIFSMPSIYAIPLAFILKELPLDLTTTFVWTPLNYMKGSLVATSLITLGIQLSKTKVEFKDAEVYLTSILRLVIGPIVGYFMISAFGFTGTTAQTLFIISALPPAVNTALIAVEQENFEDFATQVVVASTVISALTLTFAIFWSQILFPI